MEGNSFDKADSDSEHRNVEFLQLATVCFLKQQCKQLGWYKQDGKTTSMQFYLCIPLGDMQKNSTFLCYFILFFPAKQLQKPC